MKFVITFYCLILYLYSNAQTETLVYDLKVSGKIIGTVTAKKIIQGSFITYLSDTDAKISFFGITQIKTNMKVIFENGKLYESSYKFYKNNNIKEETKITLKSGNYLLIHDGKTSLLTEPIYVSTIILPFCKPKNNEKVFEEVEGYFKSIKLINNKSYHLIDPKSSHEDIYVYENNKMQYCLVNNTLVDFEMILQSKYYSQNVEKL